MKTGDIQATTLTTRLVQDLNLGRLREEKGDLHTYPMDSLGWNDNELIPVVRACNKACICLHCCSA